MLKRQKLKSIMMHGLQHTHAIVVNAFFTVIPFSADSFGGNKSVLIETSNKTVLLVTKNLPNIIWEVDFC